jgi:hypothetical protein
MSAKDPNRTSDRAIRRIGSSASSASYFFIVIVIRHETAAAARWALLLIVRTLFNDAVTVAVWTGFHVCLPVDIFASLTRQSTVMHRGGIASFLMWVLGRYDIEENHTSCQPAGKSLVDPEQNARMFFAV